MYIKKLTNNELIKTIEELETYIYNNEVSHLAHYTSPEGLESIIKYRTLIFTHSKYLKDKETRHNNEDSIKKAILRTAKARAKKKGIVFDITIDDFNLPDKCPLLGIPLAVNYDISSDNSYSLDKIIPELGYVKGNVWIISNKANAIKSNASLEELQLLVKNLETYWIH